VPKAYPAEFRRKVLDLDAAGCLVAQVAADLGISERASYVWRRQELIDTGQTPGTTTSENAELRVARQGIAQLETELAIHRQATELFGGCMPNCGSGLVSRRTRRGGMLMSRPGSRARWEAGLPRIWLCVACGGCGAGGEVGGC